jgi:serine/threonine-protein kinase
MALSELASNWAAISALLDKALSLPPSEREKWLSGLTGADAEHRDALQTLLSQRNQTGFLSELPPLGGRPVDLPGDGLAEGEHVGPYRLVSEIGAGGMGTVWLADRVDGMGKRRVALKLPRIVWGGAFVERLVREREILATLEHEHIARLYDAGIDAKGRPYLAMEYVDGESIDAYCGKHAPSLRERIELLLQVMSAVARAHAQLIVHRDLKPHNILVTRERRVKLLDFGIAKLLEGDRTQETALTSLSGRALTLDYASPEQIRGEPLGTASDIYSMAVVAYEMLTGTRPYRLKRASAAELEEAIASVEPPLASASASDPRTARQLGGDLDSILNKALKKAPGDRYATMDAFAQDLQRYLDGRPVEARPDALRYRTAKFVRRHRLQVGAGATVAVALVVGTTVALWQAHQARTAAATATAVQEFIESVFNANRRYQANPHAAESTTARELLDRGAERIDKELAAEPEAQLRLYDLLARMYAGMAVTDRSLALYQRALDLATQLHGAGSGEALNAATGVGSMLEDMNKHDQAQAVLLKADAAARGRRSDRDVFRMNIDTLLARSYYYGSDLPKGLARARNAGAIARELGPSEDGINSLTMVGVLANEAGHPEEARRALEDAVAWVDRLHVQGVLPNILSSLAEAQDELGLIEPAVATLKRAIALSESLGDLKAVIVGRYRLARFQYQNRLLRDAVATAGPEYDRLHAQAAAPALFDLPAVVMVNYGRALIAFGNADRGLVVLDEARPHLRQIPNRLAPLLAARADALVALHRLPEAGTEIEQSLALMSGTGDRIVRGIRSAHRRYLAATGKADEALKDLAADPLKPGETNTPNKRLWRQVEEAALQLAAGHDAVARDTAKAVLATVEQLPDRRFFGEAEAQMNAVLGETLLRDGHAAEAVPVLQKALALHVATYDPGSPATANVRRALTEAQRRAPEAVSNAHDAAPAAKNG